MFSILKLNVFNIKKHICILLKKQNLATHANLGSGLWAVSGLWALGLRAEGRMAYNIYTRGPH